LIGCRTRRTPHPFLQNRHDHVIANSVRPSNHRAKEGGQTKETAMAKGQAKSTKEARKPKKEKVKTIAAAPSMKGTIKT
jgi:hypothetical protein